MQKQYNIEEAYSKTVKSLDFECSLPGFKYWLWDCGTMAK